MQVLISTSATARQQANAKAVFGSKSVSILKALEEVSKEKTLATPGLDAFLADLKLSGEAFEKVSSKAAFTKAVAAAKAFVVAKTFTAKIAALKSLKYSAPKGADIVPSAPVAKQKSKLDQMAKLTAEQSVPAKNLGELYDRLQELADGDLTTDTRLLNATIGKNKMTEIQSAADSDGQMGIVIGTSKHEVTIIHKKEAPDLFSEVAKLSGMSMLTSDFIIFADKSTDGPFFSAKLKLVPGSALTFTKKDSKTAFDHLKRLCN